VQTTEAPRPRYRNPAVYRSAERLLAAPPKRSATKLPRSFYFGAGLAIGLGLAVVIPTLWFASRPAPALEAKPVPPAASGARPPASVSRPAPPAPAIAPRTAASRVVVPAAPPRTTPADDETSTLWAKQRAAIQTFVAWVPTETRRSSRTTYTIVTRFVAELQLRGRLRTEGGPVFSTEFEIFRLTGGDGKRLYGTVRYAELDGPAVATIRLDGLVVDGAIQLRETTPTGAIRPSFLIGRKFEIQLPNENDRPELLGVWTLGGTHGTVELVVVPPAELSPRRR
jgi:hypothetical protein